MFSLESPTAVDVAFWCLPDLELCYLARGYLAFVVLVNGRCCSGDIPVDIPVIALGVDLLSP